MPATTRSRRRRRRYNNRTSQHTPMNGGLRDWSRLYGGCRTGRRRRHETDEGKEFRGIDGLSIRHEDDVVVAHLQPCGQEITAGIAEADGENNRNERPIEPRHVGAE